MLSNTTVATTYQGDGSTTSFAVTFALIANSQVKVKRYDSSTLLTEILVVGTHYNLTGSPATAVAFVAAPTSTQQITVYRSTTLVQSVDYMDTAAFPIDDHETQMDKMVMMIQEISRDVSLISLSNGYTRLTTQAVAGSGTINASTDQRALKGVYGASGEQTCNTTTPISAGSVDGQELRLVGTSDSSPLILTNSGNVSLNGNIIFFTNTVLDLFWDSGQSKWVEAGRRS